MRRIHKTGSLARITALLLVLGLCLGACGKKNESSAADTAPAETTPAETETEPVETSGEMDKSGQYPLDPKTKEAVITGPEFVSSALSVS